MPDRRPLVNVAGDLRELPTGDTVAGVVHLAGAETITGKKQVNAEFPIRGPRPWIDMTAYGADPAGATSSTTAWNDAMAAAGPVNGMVWIPAGNYRFATAPNTIPAFVRVAGAGQYHTRLVPQFTTGDFITMGGASALEGVWILGPSNSTVAAGTLSATAQTINVNNSTVDFPSSGTGRISLTNGTWAAITWTGKTNLSLTGVTGSGAFSANANIMIRSANAMINTGADSLILIRDVRIDQAFNGIQSGGVLVEILDVHVRNCVNCHVICEIDDGTPYVRNLSTDNDYAQAAAGFRQTQGSVVMSDCQIMRARIGLDFPVATGGIFSPFIKNVFLDNCADAGMSITGPGTPNVFDRGKFEMVWFSSSTNGAVLNNTGIRGADFDNCDFYLNTNDGMRILAAGEVGMNYCRVANNTAAGISAAATGTPAIAIMNCLVGPVGSALTGNGTGITFAAGTYGNVRVVGNDLAGNTNGPLVDNITVANPNQKQIVANNGLAVAPRPRTVATTITGTTETVVTDGGQVYLPAHSLKVGTTLTLTAHGVITATSPTLLPRLRIGTAGTTADTQVCATGATAITSGTGWVITAMITVRAIGTSGTAVGNLILDASTTARTVQTATVTVNTTVANFLSFTLTASGTSPVITPANVAWRVESQS